MLLRQPWLFPVFDNAKLTKQELLGKIWRNYLRLKKSQITQCLTLFQYCAQRIHINLLWGDKHGILGLCSMTEHHINKTTAVSWGRWRERSRWKMEEKHQDKWILSQTFLSITKLHKPQNISVSRIASIHITKFTCHPGNGSKILHECVLSLQNFFFLNGDMTNANYFISACCT